MTDFYIPDGGGIDDMYKWIEEHNLSCKFAYLGMVDRFSYDSVPENNLCVVRVTCKCGEIKVVTICDRE